MIKKIVQVKDEDRLLRRAPLDPSYIRDDMTVTSFAFKLRKSEEGLSVDIERLTTYADSIVSARKYRLFAVSVYDVRDISLDCVHKPIDGNYAHAEIVGADLRKNRVSSQLARRAVYIDYPKPIDSL